MLTKSTKIMIFIFLAIDFLVWGAYLYALNSIKTSEFKMLSLEESMKENLRRQEIKMFTSKNLDMTTENRERMQEYIIEKEGEVDFIKQIEDLVKERGLKSEIKSVSLESFPGSAIIENLHVKIDVIGDWTGVVNFQKSLEVIPLAITLDSVAYNKYSTYNSDGKTINQWLGSFSFKIAKIKN